MTDEARVRALGQVEVSLSENEEVALDELADLMANRGQRIAAGQRVAIVAAARAAAPINPLDATKGLLRYYGPGKPGATAHITDIAALFTTEISRQHRAAVEEAAPPKRFEFAKPKSKRADAISAAPSEAPSTSALPSGLERPTSLEADWQRIREALEASVSGSTWPIWLESLELAGCVNHLVTELDDERERPLPTIFLTAPAEKLSWIEQRFLRLLHSCTAAVLGAEIPVVVVAAEQASTLRVVA